MNSQSREVKGPEPSLGREEAPRANHMYQDVQGVEKTRNIWARTRWGPELQKGLGGSRQLETSCLTRNDYKGRF